jgi:hypothetical protein
MKAEQLQFVQISNWSWDCQVTNIKEAKTKDVKRG